MNFRAAGGRCCVWLGGSLLLEQNGICPRRAEEVLHELGFKTLSVDIAKLAREQIGRATYSRGALPIDAPAIVDCSTFTKWLYAQMGIWLPRYAIDQRAAGVLVERESLRAGDLVFSQGSIGRYRDDPADRVGHVGIMVDEATVVHAASSRVGVIQTPLSSFCPSRDYRGARRYFDAQCLVFETPLTRCVETSDDLIWAILEQVPWTS